MIDLTAARIVFDVGRDADVRRERRTLDLADGQSVTADLYRPGGVAPGQRLPVVVFVHGDASAAFLAGVLDWAQYRSWGEAIASLGLCALVFEHRSSENLRFAHELLDEVRGVIDRVRDPRGDLGIDPARVGVWTASGGSNFGVAAALLAEPPVACIVSYYGFLDVRHVAATLNPSMTPGDAAAVSPATLVATLDRLPPTLIVRVALDYPEINASVDTYVAAAAGRGDVRVAVHRTGHHAFDIVDDDPTSRALISDTLAFLRTHLAVE